MDLFSFFRGSEPPPVLLDIPLIVPIAFNGETLFCRGTTPEEVLKDFKEQVDRKDQEDGSITFWELERKRLMRAIEERFSALGLKPEVEEREKALVH